METLSKTEQAHVERMSEPFAESSPQENFEKWAERSISHSKEEKKEKQKNSGPREIKLTGRPEEEREWIEKVAQKDESKDSAKESEKGATARPEQRPDAKPTTSEPNSSPNEPLSGDQHWNTKYEGKQAQEHWQRIDGRIGIALQHISQDPQRQKIEQGLQAIFAGKNPAQQSAFLGVLATSLAEVPNPGEVLRHFALQPEHREALRQAKNWQEIRSYVHQVSKAYPAAASQASPKPRASKPPSEVGGRGAVVDDGTRGETDFGNFSARMGSTLRSTIGEETNAIHRSHAGSKKTDVLESISAARAGS
jgi:hypothetical protein